MLELNNRKELLKELEFIKKYRLSGYNGFFKEQIIKIVLLHNGKHIYKNYKFSSRLYYLEFTRNIKKIYYNLD